MFPLANNALELLQVFYQGIDKVSKVVEKPSSCDEPLDDAEREGKGEGAEGVVGDDSGDGMPAEDSPTKEDDEPDENGEGEKHEMTDEELAARCGCCLVCRRIDTGRLKKLSNAEPNRCFPSFAHCL